MGGKTKACSDACTECKREDFKLNGGNCSEGMEGFPGVALAEGNTGL